LDGSDIATNRQLSKLSHWHLGPFVVEACVSHGPYHLALPPHFRRLQPIFPMVKPSPMLPDPIPGWWPVPLPPPTLVDSEEEYRSRLYWCVTTTWSTWSSGRAMMRVTINGRCIHRYMQSWYHTQIRIWICNIE
jgi:hypothetical protein